MRVFDILIVQKMLLTSFFTMICCVGCAQKHTGKSMNQYASIDSVMRQTLGDSLSQIILCARQIEVKHFYMSGDSIKQESSLKLPSSKKELIRFLMTDSANYEISEVVYGIFSPSVGFYFKDRDRQCRTYFDFGLRKWQVCDGEDKKIVEFDIQSDAILRFAYWLFPDDELLEYFTKKE